MRKLNYELELSRRPDYPSSCLRRTPIIMGYPCGHDLQQFQGAGRPVPLSKVHRHWRFEPLQEEQLDSSPEPDIQAPDRHQRGRQNSTEASSEASDMSSERGSPATGAEQPTHLSRQAPSNPAEPTRRRAAPGAASEFSQVQHQKASSVRKRTLRSGRSMGQNFFTYIYKLIKVVCTVQS